MIPLLQNDTWRDPHPTQKNMGDTPSQPSPQNNNNPKQKQKKNTSHTQ